jgi:hypothetical protein
VPLEPSHYGPTVNDWFTGNRRLDGEMLRIDAGTAKLTGMSFHLESYRADFDTACNDESCRHRDRRRVTDNRSWLVGHGTTGWSPSGTHTGNADVPLVDEGREAAKRVGRVLRGRGFALVLSNPRSRFRETAALAGFADPVIDRYLSEWDYDEVGGKTTDEMHRTDMAHLS